MTATGRSELLHAWAVGGDDGLKAMARLLGYQESRAGEKIAPTTEEEPRVTEPRGGLALEPAPASDLAPVPFWHVTEIESLETELEPVTPPPARPLGLAGLGRRACFSGGSFLQNETVVSIRVSSSISRKTAA